MAGKAGVLQSMGFQRVRHNGTTRRLKLFYIQEVGSVGLGVMEGMSIPEVSCPVSDLRPLILIIILLNIKYFLKNKYLNLLKTPII